MNSLELVGKDIQAQTAQLADSGPIIQPVVAEPTPAPAPESEPAAAPADSWMLVTPAVMTIVDNLVLPQWSLKDAEKKELQEASGQILDQLFPGGLSNEKWAPYIRLTLAGCTIVLARIDPDTKKLPPFGLPKKAPAVPVPVQPTSGAEVMQ